MFTESRRTSVRSNSVPMAARLMAALVLAGGAARPAAAQIFQEAVGNTPFEVAYSIEETRDCGYITAGEGAGTPAAGTGQMLIAKHRYDGSLVWSRLITIGNRSTAYSVHETVSPGYIVGGESNFAPPLGIILARLDPGGNPMWVRGYAGTAYLDFPAGVAVRGTRDDGAVAVGRLQPAIGGPTAGLLMRVNPGGGPLFQRTYQLPGAQTSTSFTDVREIPSGFLVCGTLVDPGTGLERAVLMQTDGGGNPVLVRTYGDGADRVFGDGMDLDPAGGVILSGRIVPPAGGPPNMHVTRLDAAFNATWTQIVVRTTPAFAGVRWTIDGDVIASGTSAPAAGGLTAAVLTRFTAVGAPTLSRQFGGGNSSTEGHGAIRPVRRIAYALAGRTSIAPNNGPTDQYLVVSNFSGLTNCLESVGPQIQAAQFFTIPVQLAAPFVQLTDIFGLPAAYPLNVITYCRHGCAADFDGDGAVTPADIAAFVNNWFASLSAGNLGGDYDCNQIVQPADMAQFVNDWNTALSSGC